MFEILESTNVTDSNDDNDGKQQYQKAHLKWFAPFMISMSTFFLAKCITYTFMRYGYKKRAEQISILGLLNVIIY